jgi:hypothetical protein
MMTNEQLTYRIFTLHTSRGLKFALDFTEGVIRDYGEHAWIISCGAEMLLRCQLPERAASLERERARLLMAHCIYLPTCPVFYIWREHQRPTYRQCLSLHLLDEAAQYQLPEHAESLQEQEAQEYYEASCLWQGKVK